MSPADGRLAFGNDDPVGWPLMMQEENADCRQEMWSFKSYDECEAYQLEHRQAMATRTTEQGKIISLPRFTACDRVKARGVLM